MADETDAQVYREAAAEAQVNGDVNAANEAYASELEALEEKNNVKAEGEQDEGEQGIEPFNPDYVENVFTALTEEFGEEQVATLRSHWVDDDQVREGVALGQALAEDHPELNAIAEEFGLADHPGLLALAEFIARKSGYTFDTTGARKSNGEIPMETKGGLSREAFRKGMRSFDERIALAQSEGNAALANEIYTKQMNWIASVKGDTPIVGGRTATGLRNV